MNKQLTVKANLKMKRDFICVLAVIAISLGINSCSSVPSSDSHSDYPYGVVISGKKNLVLNPYNRTRVISVEGLPAGSLAMDPVTRQRFRVPSKAVDSVAQKRQAAKEFAGATLGFVADLALATVSVVAQNPQVFSGSSGVNSTNSLMELQSASVNQNIDRVNESFARKDREDRLIQEAHRERKRDLELKYSYLASNRLGASYAVNGVIANVYFQADNMMGITESQTTISPSSFIMTGRTGWIVIDGTVSGYSRAGQFHSEKFEVMFHKDQDSEKETIVNGSDDFSRGISSVRITGYR